MAGWVGPTVAISMLLIAACVVGMTLVALKVFTEVQQASRGLTNELAELRHELAPMLTALNRFGDAGADVVESARAEVQELVATSQELRVGIRRTQRRAARRLADLDALLEVMQEEVEETALDAATALRTFRNGTGVLGQVGRFLAPSRRRGEDDDA
jgi:methyl-accepting chemotaxis protein